MVKKTIVLNQDFIDVAKLFFQVKTDKEAVNKALEMAVKGNKIGRNKKIGKKGDVIANGFV